VRARFFIAAAAVTALAAVLTPSRAPAQNPAVACARIGLDELGSLAGTPVAPPDETAAASGVCLFAARSATQDALVSYAIVTPANLQQRTAYYAVQARLCAGVAPDAPRAAECAAYAKLAEAQTPSAYFDARSQSAAGAPGLAQPPPQAVLGLGDRALALADALFVQRGNLVLELVVRREDIFDLEDATKLAQLLLERIPPAENTSQAG
jgi:hypothetical protein